MLLCNAKIRNSTLREQFQEERTDQGPEELAFLTAFGIGNR